MGLGRNSEEATEHNIERLHLSRSQTQDADESATEMHRSTHRPGLRWPNLSLAMLFAWVC